MAGHIRPRGPNKWLLVVDLGKGLGGKRRTKSKVSRGGIRAAEKEHARLQVLWADGAGLNAETTTAGKLFELWLESYAQPNLSESAYKLYETFIRVHLTPALGHILLAKLRPLQVEAYYRAALTTGNRRGGGLALRTVQQQHRLLRQIFRQALRWEVIQRNPLELVTPPQLPKDKRAPRRRNAIDPADLARVLDAVWDTFLRMPVLLSVTTGLRRGEVLGLRWRDVDLETGRFQVEQSLVQTRKAVKFNAPKTESSLRAIHLPAALLPALREHRAEQAERQQLLGAAYEDNGLICCWEDGRYIRPDSATRAFSAIVRRLELDVTFHALRRTHSSLLQADGEHPKVVSSRLGHKSVDITLDLYTEITAEQDQAAANRMNGRLDSLLRRPESGAVGRIWGT